MALQELITALMSAVFPGWHHVTTTLAITTDRFLPSFYLSRTPNSNRPNLYYNLRQNGHRHRWADTKSNSGSTSSVSLLTITPARLQRRAMRSRTMAKHMKEKTAPEGPSEEHPIQPQLITSTDLEGHVAPPEEEDVFGNEEGAEIQYKTCKWCYVLRL